MTQFLTSNHSLLIYNLAELIAKSELMPSDSV